MRKKGSRQVNSVLSASRAGPPTQPIPIPIPIPIWRHPAEIIIIKTTNQPNQTNLGPISFRNSKELLFVQLATAGEKEAMIDYIKLSNPHDILKETLLPSPGGNSGLHFERLPIKLEINTLHSTVKFEKVKEMLESLIDNSKGGRLLMIKDGKISNQTNKRTISMKVNGAAFWDVFATMNGIIPYKDGKVKTNLFVRVNCRPWQCRACYAIGHHPTCEGKVCNKCGSKDHQATSCIKKTRFCRNCKKPGHSARDTHCPEFLNEFAKEIRKYDFPLEYLEESERIAQLVKQLQLK